jgi:hypothetical protein
MKDKIITCIQCESPFVFSVSEQKHFMAVGFGEPKRCPACRKNKSKGTDVKAPRKNNGKKKYFRRKYEN